MKTMMTRLIAAAALCLLPATADAAVTHIVKDGKLMGATGVTIGTKTYDVSFVDGTCAEVFGACETSKFDIDQYGYADAAMALSKQVFVDTDAFNFDSFPNATNGCTDKSECSILVPVYVGPFITGSTSLVYGYVYNHATEQKDATSSGFNVPTIDLSTESTAVFARFTLNTSGGSGVPGAAAVPEPATWALMLAGFGLTGAAMRRRRRAGAVGAVA